MRLSERIMNISGFNLNFGQSKVVPKFQFMPIFFQQDIDADTKMGIWKIEEAESFFDVPLQRTITHPHKRLQHLAGRYLLRHLFPEFPLEMIRLADTKKPFLEGEPFHFSISHSGDFAAAMVSRINRTGVDIEKVSEKVAMISHKFLSGKDKEILDEQSSINKVQLMTMMWSCKEAVFKWYGLGGVDFREHMQLISVSENIAGWENVIRFQKQEEIFLDLHSRFFGELCLSWVVT
jgi:phosphopantetheinyl transferase